MHGVACTSGRGVGKARVTEPRDSPRPWCHQYNSLLNSSRDNTKLGPAHLRESEEWKVPAYLLQLWGLADPQPLGPNLPPPQFVCLDTEFQRLSCSTGGWQASAELTKKGQVGPPKIITTRMPPSPVPNEQVNQVPG